MLMECILNNDAPNINGIAIKNEKRIASCWLIPKNNSVEIDGLVDGVKVYYTLDGSDPTSKSAIYDASIKIDDAFKFKAVLEDSAGRLSAVTKIIDQETVRVRWLALWKSCEFWKYR